MQPVHCSPSAFGLLLHRNRSLALLSAAGLPSAAPANPSQRLWPTPAAQPCLRQAGAWGESPGTCSPCSYGLPKATLGFLHRLQTLPRGCKPFPAPLAYSCIAALPASGGSLGREPWNVQPVLLWASKSDVRHFAPPSNPPPRLQTLPSAFGLLPAALPSSSSRQLAGLPLLFLWASKSDVRHFAPPLNPPRAFKPFPAPLAYSCIAALPCLCVRREPGERAPPPRLQTLPSAFGLLLHRSLALFLFSAARRPASSLSKSDVRHFAPPLNPPRALKPFPAPLAYSCIAALLASGGSLGREPWNAQPVLLWASKSDVRHFKPLGSLAYSCTAALPSSFSRQLAGLPLLFLWASKSDVRHFAPPLNPPRAFKPFPAPLAYSCIAALLASGGSLGREPWNVQPVLLWASKSDVRHFAPPSNPPPRLQTLPSAFGLLLHRSLALFLFSAARRPASSLLMGFQKRR